MIAISNNYDDQCMIDRSIMLPKVDVSMPRHEWKGDNEFVNVADSNLVIAQTVQPDMNEFEDML